LARSQQGVSATVIQNTAQSVRKIVQREKKLTTRKKNCSENYNFPRFNISELNFTGMMLLFELKPLNRLAGTWLTVTKGRYWVWSTEEMQQKYEFAYCSSTYLFYA
jgi:hypothetical protein